jgi:hypothetical protein
MARWRPGSAAAGRVPLQRLNVGRWTFQSAVRFFEIGNRIREDTRPRELCLWEGRRNGRQKKNKKSLRVVVCYSQLHHQMRRSD